MPNKINRLLTDHRQPKYFVVYIRVLNNHRKDYYAKRQNWDLLYGV